LIAPFFVFFKINKNLEFCPQSCYKALFKENLIPDRQNYIPAPKEKKILDS